MPTRPFEAANKVAIVGVGHSKLSRRGDRAIGALAVDAALTAIADAGLTLADIDGISNWPATTGQGVGPVDGWTNANLEWMVQGLGIEQVNWWGNGGGGNISAAVGHTILPIAAVLCDHVLV